MFIVFEGPDGAGKTTLAGLIKNRLGMNAILGREPDALNPVGKILRQALDSADSRFFDTGILPLLFTADRLIHEIEINAWLEIPRQHYITDRYWHSTWVYQYLLRGSPRNVRDVLEGYPVRRPDITYLLDAPTKVLLERVAKRKGDPLSPYETEEKLAKIRIGYRQLPAMLPKETFVTVPTWEMNGLEEVCDFVWNDLQKRLP